MNYPKKVDIIEVCPRDGFQNIKTFIDTKYKLEIIDALADAGAKSIEVANFASPKYILQATDAIFVTSTCAGKPHDYEMLALAPNRRGIENAVNSGCKKASLVISASEAHNMANVNKTIDQSFAEFKSIIKDFPRIEFRLSIATVFGYLNDELINLDRVFAMINESKALGVKEFVLSDTLGTANPKHVEEVLMEVKEKIGSTNIILHMHDTSGCALSNMLIAMQLGFSKFETAVAGLGGCPYAPGAAGNVATEDFVNMLDGMGIAHDFNLLKLKRIIELIERYVDAKPVSHMYNIWKSSCYAAQ